MTRQRLEAFSDAVIAILITIMVLELSVPEGHEWDSLRDLVPTFLAYVLSVSLLAAIAYYILQRTIIGEHGPDSKLAVAVGKDVKGKISPVGYLAGIALAGVAPAISLGLYAAVALMWLIPDRRIESALES